MMPFSTRKKLLSRALVLLLLPALFPFPQLAHADGFDGTGAGTEGDPFVITTCAELQEISLDLTAYYVLGSDINCAATNPSDGSFDEAGPWADGQGFIPLGNTSGNVFNMTHENFTGVLDGQNHTISNLFIARTGAWNDISAYYIGLFATIGTGAEVKNITFDNASVSSAHGNDVGLLAGGLSGTATNIHATNSTVNGIDRVGGLVGAHFDESSFPNSSPLVYTWNGTKYTYTDDVGQLLPKGLSGADYAQIDSTNLAPKDGKYSIKIAEEYNETVYYDELALMTFDHVPGYSVVEPLNRTAGAGDLRTVSDTPTNPLVSCTDEKGQDCTNALKSFDDQWSYTNENGAYDPKNLNKSWVLDFGTIADASSTVLILRGARDYAASAKYPGNSNRSIQVKDANGNWVEIYNKNQIGSDGTPRLRTIDLAGKFLSSDHHVKIAFDTFNANYFAVDTSAQVPFTTHTYHPDSASLDFHGFTAIDKTHYYKHDYDTVSPTPEHLFKNQYGNFTKYGDVTPLLTAGDDHPVVMRYGDQISAEFPYEAPAPGMVRSFILFNDALYKHATYQNLGEYGQNANYLPYHAMTKYGPGMTPYPMTESNTAYVNTWNTRNYPGPFPDALLTHGSTIINSSYEGSVTGNQYVGGLVGMNAKEIRYSYASSTVSGNYDIGGLVGYNDNAETAWIHDTYATGPVNASYYYSGGLIGFNYGKVEHSYSSGLVTGASYVGGFTGVDIVYTPGLGISNSFTVSELGGSPSNHGGFLSEGYSDDLLANNNYWFNAETDGIALGDATVPLKAASADVFKNSKTTSPLDTWNFDDVWQKVPAGYPIFIWQNPSPTTYTLTYVAGAGGSITGTTTQTVTNGDDGTLVTAVPASGYTFTKWDDNSTANPRTDTVVTADHTYTATFTAIPETPRRKTGGSTVQAQVATLIQNGNTAGANQVIQQFSGLFTGQPGGASGSSRDLHSGVSGTDVRSLQQFLNAHGFVVSIAGPGSAGNETNLFGAATKAAVMKFQMANGIVPATGYVGPLTRAKLVELSSGTTSASAPTPTTTTTRDLQFGMSGDDVRTLQQFLIAQNTGVKAQALAKNGVSGFFGQLTKDAVIEFQKAKGISPASGYVGSATRAAI